jgi:hypothetical protein
MDATMNIKERSISELKGADYNPRKLNMKDYKGLRDSLKKYGFLDPVLVNMFEGRENIIISGHQRLRAWKELGHETVPVIELNLPEEEEKELNIRMNRSAGMFDFEKLGMMFSKDKLEEIGFNRSELEKIESEFERSLKQFDNNNCEYPIVPKFNEKYDYMLIVCENDMDNLRLRTTLGVDKMKSYKNYKNEKDKIGKGYVLPYKEFMAKFVEGDGNL